MPGLWRRSAKPAELTKEEVVSEVKKEQEPTPQYVTADELNATLDRATQHIIGTVQGIVTPQRQQPVYIPQVEAEIPDVREDEMAQAFEKGDLVIYDKLQKQRIARERQQYRREIGQLKNEGMQAISQLTQQITAPKRSGLEKYQGEINAILDTFPIETRANQSVLEFVYDSIRGKHQEEIFAQRVDEQKRQAATKPTQAVGDAATDRATGIANKTSAWHETLDQRMRGRNATPAADSLATTGKEPDAFARQLGYKNMDDYLAKTAEYETKKTHKW